MSTSAVDSLYGPDPRRIRIAAGFGLTAIALFLALALRSPTALYLGLFLGLVGFGIAADRALQALWREPLFWIGVILFVWVLIRGWIDLATADARGFDPDEDAVWHHARYTLFLPVVMALWLAAWWRHRHVLLLLVGLAALFYYISKWDRLSIVLPTANGDVSSAMGEGGLMSATVMFLAAGLLGSIWVSRHEYGPVLRRVLLTGAVAMLLLNIVILIMSVSRAAWLATLGTLFVFALVGGWFLWKHAPPRQQRIALGIGAAVLTLFGVGVVASWDMIVTRLLRDTDTLRVLLTEGYDPEISGSFAARYRMFLQFTVDIREYPIWGVGPGSVRDMLHVIWDQPRGGSGNYHSAYLNLLVAMGIPWTLLWVGGHIWAVWRAVRELLFRDRDIALAFGLLGAAMAHFGTLTFQGGRLWSAQGSALYLVLMMIICAVFLRGAVRRQGLARE